MGGEWETASAGALEDQWLVMATREVWTLCVICSKSLTVAGCPEEWGPDLPWKEKERREAQLHQVGAATV